MSIYKFFLSSFILFISFKIYFFKREDYLMNIYKLFSSSFVLFIYFKMYIF